MASLTGALIIVVCIAIWFAFTPEKLTPVVRHQAERFITCQSEIGDVELTFFSTFPHFGIKISHFSLINHVNDAQSDTLVNAEELVGIVDASAWWKEKKIVLTGLEINSGSINVFSDSLGNTNYDIFSTDTASVEAGDPETALPVVDISDVQLNDIDLSYKDLSLKLNTIIKNLTAQINGTVRQDSISGTLKADWSWVSLVYEGEEYVKATMVQCNIPVDIIPSHQFIRLKNASVSINDLRFSLDGTVENDDSDNGNIYTDIRYKLKSWPVKEILHLVPSSFHSYFEGIDADGLLSSDGIVKGVMNESVMPVLDINLVIGEGKLKYSEIPVSLHDISGDITICTDMATDSVSFVRINRFSAKTPQSTFKTEGLINHLFSDICCDLTTEGQLRLDEFGEMIPDSMKIVIRGAAAGKVKSTFSLNQLENMQLEKMKLSGSVTLNDFDVVYDSIFLKTDRSEVDFAMPNNKASAGKTKFASATIMSDNIMAGKIESYNASLRNASISVETSDARDTTRIPDLICSFDLEHMKASLDTMNIDMAKPRGKVSISPGYNAKDQPIIKLSCNSGLLKAALGKSTASVDKINIDTEISNDNTQKDMFLQWVFNGFIDIDQAIIALSGLSYPIEIPSLEMSFEPEIFSIRESKIKIDKSDFQLTGNLNNVLSYLRGDSILRGKFDFVSNTTDAAQLMALTNGIGSGDSAAVEQTKEAEIDSTYTGPYMVPKGVDLLLNTNIKTATLGIDTATNITGDVRVSDGILLLDGLTFDTPAARMQLTAMYRTPRKNHLFLGLDYHMLDIDIGELSTMIPDIDSLMPMLKSFKGKGEFHIAVETYLDSLYNLKKSTLRGAASIKGNNLVLMDGETFSEIARTLKFNKRTENRIDSLSAEFTIFRNEIDIYPFLIVMDKYKAVIAGRHNFDLSFDYNVSVVDCPLPIKLGVDVKGTIEDLKYQLGKCRYAEFYRPPWRRAVENKQLDLRNMIRNALTRKVIE